MSLQDKLGDRRKNFESSAPPEKLAIMHRATNDLRLSGIMERVLKTGDRAPNFSLPDEHGNLVGSFWISKGQLSALMPTLTIQKGRNHQILSKF